MDNKITVSLLANILSQTTGKSRKLCEDFIREFFKLAAESIEAGESLRIKGFGTFKVVDVESRTAVNVNSGEKQEIPPHKKVVFTPAKEMASAINAPFAEFETVEMDDEIPEDIFIERSDPEEIAEAQSAAIRHIETEVPLMENEEISKEDNVSNERLELGSDEEMDDDNISLEAYSIEEANNQTPEEIPAATTEDTPEDIPENTPEDIPEEDQNEEIPPIFVNYETPAKSRFGVGFLLGALSTLLVCVVIFMLGCFFDWWPVNFGNPFKTNGSIENVATTEQPVPEDETEVIPEQEPVYDTVSTTRYLTTISRDHYGDYNFWPYIYIENESILGHPDRITPGTRVVVPDLSKYGVDVNNPEDIKEAKRKGVEIYARF